MCQSTLVIGTFTGKHFLFYGALHGMSFWQYQKHMESYHSAIKVSEVKRQELSVIAYFLWLSLETLFHFLSI